MTILYLGIAVSMALSTLYAARYDVGPGKTFQTPSGVPWEALSAGDSILIWYRTQAYNDKWVICAQGTNEQPIVIQGVADAQGRLPFIDGRDATTRTQLNFWNESRGVIKIGGANSPSDRMPQHIILENLDIGNGRQPYSFSGRNGLTDYAKNCAALYVEKGEHITIRNCILRDCGNGLFCANASSDILVEHCGIYDNGVENSIYEHNNYTESRGITFQYNYFGPLRTNCLGNNLKDRSAGLVVRYNWIEAGNRQLDLVDAGDAALYTSTAYRSTFVYGNILIEPDNAGNSQICHYGGDSGDESRYRKGTLFFYNNTVLSTRTGNTTLLRLSSSEESADVRNTILYTTASGNRCAILDNTGRVELRSNWLQQGWRTSHGNSSADVDDIAGNIVGEDPGLIALDSFQVGLAAGSACIDAGTNLHATAQEVYPVTSHYAKHRGAGMRTTAGAIDIGAFEYEKLQQIRFSRQPRLLQPPLQKSDVRQKFHLNGAALRKENSAGSVVVSVSDQHASKQIRVGWKWFPSQL